MEKIRVVLKNDSRNSGYGYYVRGDKGYVVGFVTSCAVIILDNGKFAMAELNDIERIDEIEEISGNNEKCKDDELDTLIKKSIDYMEGRKSIIEELKQRDESGKFALFYKEGFKAGKATAERIDKSAQEWYEEGRADAIAEMQKPAWSEEDEKLVKNLISTLSNLYARNLIEKETKEKYTNLLKSLKERVQPQQRQEWSDVDKDILFRTIDSLKFLKDTISTDTNYAVNIIDIEREITWLKSLRPQNRWKPSDEQIKVCKEVYADILSAKGFDLGTVNGELNRLEEQLKKLKG